MKFHELLAAAMAATATRSAAFAFRPSLHSPPRPPPSLSSRGGSTVASHHSSYSSSSTQTTLLLLATKKRPNNDNTRGFDPKRKYSIDDEKSYGGSKSNNGEGGKTLSDDDLSAAGMADFFASHPEWEPLFRGILLHGGEGGGGSDDDDGDGAPRRRTGAASAAMAHPILASPDRSGDGTAAPDDDDLWGMPTLEMRNPWRLLPPRPTSKSSLGALSSFLDEWQKSLLDIPLDEVVTGVNDRHFLEEGRRTIAVTRFHVLGDGYRQHRELADDDDDDDDDGRVAGRHQNYDWETELFRTCWSELAHLTYQNVGDTGSLVLLPDINGALDGAGGGSGPPLGVVADFVERNLMRPMRWLGRDGDWEIVAMERGGVAVRLLYKLGGIPDIERNGGVVGRPER